MFAKTPNILAYKSALDNGNFVLHDSIVVRNGDTYSVKDRSCPHRGYLLHHTGDVVNNVVCKLHGLAWDQDGAPLNSLSSCHHPYKLQHRGGATLGKTGILFQNFTEPQDSEWVNILSSAPPLQYDRSLLMTSNGSWLWFMEQMTDILHLQQGGIHPRQSLETPLDNITTDSGDGWVIQMYPTSYGSRGFWLFIYPGYNIEYEPGRLLVTRVTPHDPHNEYGFTVHIQFYYEPSIDRIQRDDWEKCIDVYREDISAIENIKRPFFPLKRTVSDLEALNVHWGQWYLDNKIK